MFRRRALVTGLLFANLLLPSLAPAAWSAPLPWVADSTAASLGPGDPRPSASAPPEALAPLSSPPRPLDFGGSTAQNWSPYAPPIFTDGFIDLTLPGDGAAVGALPNISVNQTGDVTLLVNGSWNPAPSAQTDRDWVMLVAVLAGRASVRTVESNTTARFTLGASELPAWFGFALPSPSNFSSPSSTASVRATLPSGNQTQLNLTAAAAGLNLSAAKRAAPIATQSVWFNASGNTTTNGTVNGTQNLTLVLPNNGLPPLELRSGQISQWTGPGSFAGGRFFLLQNRAGDGNGTMRTTLWTRGSPESGLYVNASASPANAARGTDRAVVGEVGGRTLTESTNWTVNQTAVLPPNHDFENCTNLLRLQNGSWRLFCTFVETDPNMTVTQGVDSAFSPDGLTWFWEPGARYLLCGGDHAIDNVAILRLLDGSFRMFYTGQSATNCGGGGAQSRFSTAVSADEGRTWTFEATFGNQITAPVSITFAASPQGWIRWYLLFTGFLFSFLYDGAVSGPGNITWDGPNLTANNPRTVYLLTDGSYKMYYGTTAVYSAASPDAINWTAPQLEVANWSGDIQAGPLLDKGDGALRMLLYSQTSGLYIATLGAAAVSPPSLSVDEKLSDGSSAGAVLATPDAAGAFSVNITVPPAAPLGRSRVSAAAWFGGVSLPGMVLNREPEWVGPGQLAAVEDVPFVLDVVGGLFESDEADVLVVNASSSFGTFDGVSLTLLYPNGVLTDQVVVAVSDGYDDRLFLLPVTVTPVNDPPSLSLNATYDAVEDTPTPVDFQGAYFDEETPAGLLTLTTNATGASVSGSVITFNYTTDGDRPVSVSVTDGTNTVTLPTTVHVIAVDDPPVITLNATYYGREDALITLDFGSAVFDEDTAPSSLLLATDLPGANVSNMVVTVFSSVPDAIPFNITVFDGTTAVRAASLLVVQQANDAPTIVLAAQYAGLEDATILIDLASAVSDEDTTLSSLFIVTDLPGANINGLTITLVVPRPDSIPFNVTVSDGSASMTASSRLVVEAVNDAPRWTATPTAAPTEDTPLTVNLSGFVVDEDNATSQLVFRADSPYATVNGSSIRFDYPEGVLEDNVTITVSDGLVDVPLVLHLAVRPVNDLPVLLGDPPFEIVAGPPINFTFSGSDVETPQSLTYTLDASATWITLSSDGVLTFAPFSAAHGRFPYNVTIADADGGSATRSFVVKIGNLVPVIQDIPLSARPNVLYTATVVVVDPDGDPLTVFVIPEDPTMSYNNTTGEIVWLPAFSRPPGVRVDVLVNVTIRATDGIATAARTFSIRVRDPPNEAPFFTGNLPFLQRHISEIVTLNLFDYARDLDDPNSNLTWRVEGGLDGAVALWKLDPASGSLRIEFKGEGSGNLTVSVRDRSGVGANATMRVETLAGPAPEAPTALPFPWWMLVLVLASAITTAAYGGVRASRRAPPASLAPAAPRAAPPAAPVERRAYLVENVILLSRDGRPLFARGDPRSAASGDTDVLGSMMIAVQDFVRDAFTEGGAVSRMTYGDNTILFDRGDHVVLAVTVFGEPGQAIRDLMAETVSRVERVFAGVIERWDGDREALAGLEDLLAPLWMGTAKMSRADVLVASRGTQVELLSAVEFFQGYVRVRVGVVNNTPSVINAVVVDLDYNDDVLRLARIEPSGYKSTAARVVVGSIAPGERIGLAYYLDPQICTTSSIVGGCVYKDLSGRQHVVEMKSRKAEVVCPIFFTKEQANSALLKRLIETELDLYDARAYRIKPSLAMRDLERVFAEMKAAVMAHDVQLVRSHEGRHPYSGEAWFYGRTQVKGLRMVIRAAVSPTKGRAEFFVASTAIGPITGLLAELHHTFMAALSAKLAGLGLEPLFDERLKAEFTTRSAVSKMVETEAEPGEADATDQR